MKKRGWLQVGVHQWTPVSLDPRLKVLTTCYYF
jgi:hypothetical protein